MTTRQKVYGFLAVLLIAGGGYWGEQKHHWTSALGIGASANAAAQKAKKEQKKSEPEAVLVEVAPVKTGDIAAHVSSSGNLRALRDVVIATQAEGIVQKVLAEEGDFVREGQVLCQLDEKPLRIRLELSKEKLAQAKSQLQKAGIRQEKTQVQINHADREYVRYKTAHESGLVSEQEADRRRLSLDEFKHDVQIVNSEIAELRHRIAELESEIAQAELEISRTQLKAPFSGYVTRRTVDLGQRVRNLDPMFNLGSFSPLYAEIYLSEREAHQVRAGQTAEVRLGADGDSSVLGRVERLSPIVDQASGTVKVTVELKPSASGFRPGAFVRVDIRTDTRNGVMLIPKRAVIEEDGENFVYVASNGKANRKKVSIGYESDGAIEIRSGLASGENVVVAGQGGLKEGAKVKVSQS
ncbi:MAG: efflux RND transporter periplasmic adaptor subunit [Bryobacteraceae bacterium]|nr:efflux RND transporter periplasmic adaptor subunit [Bryobacteraceae bacterium]